MSDNPSPKTKLRPGTLKLQAVVITVIAAAVVLTGVMIRTDNQHALVHLAQQQSLPVVKIIQPSPSNGDADLVLPGTLHAFYSASVYSRVTGYLKSWNADIGTEVKAGQVLATIETPELDQQLKQSEANLETAQANLRLTEITSNRWQNLLKSDSVSKQEEDEKNGDYEAKKALVLAARADVERLRALQSFRQISAPFDGIVTARKTDIGALINAGHDAGHELFTVDDVHILRLYVDVPQSYAHQITSKMKALLDIPGMPGQTFDAVLTASSHAVSENSGTMQIELQVNNHDGKLMPGGYGNVHFKLPHETNQFQIPVTALVFRRDGISVATVTPDNHVQYRAIQIGRDLGNAVEVVSGISQNDRIIDSAPDGLEQGEMVQPTQGKHS